MEQNTLDHAVWPAVEALLTPDMLGAFAVTVAATHAVKALAPVFFPTATETLPQWRAFCTVVSVTIGAIAGAAVWINSEANWAAVPIIALGSGLVWRLALAILPAKIGEALLTDTDRKWR